MFGENERLLKLIMTGIDKLRNGALNILTKEFIVLHYSSGNSKILSNLLKSFHCRHPHQQIILIWDGASYRRNEKYFSQI